MKISKRIFSLLVSLLVITSSVGVATATETTETTDGKIYHADLSSMYDMDAIANEGDELDSTTWMNGHSVSETQNEEKVTIYKGFPSTLFNSEDGYVSFRFIEATPKVANPNSSNRSHWNFSTKSDRNFKFKIPVDGLKGKFNDSVHIAKNTETTVQLSSEQKSVNAIRFAFFQFNATSNVTAKINYSDYTSDSYTQSFRGDTRGADYCLGIYSNTNVFKCCYTKFSNVGIDLENGKAVKSTTDYYDNTWGIRGYEIPVAEGKTPVSVTLSATNDIALFALAECELLNNEMQLVINEVKAYEKGIAYTSAQIEKIELAKEYADVLKERNALSAEDETTVNSLYTVAVKQKDMAGTIHLDISDKLNASTIGAPGEKYDDSTWFANKTSYNMYGYYNGNGNNMTSASDYVVFNEYKDSSDTGNKLEAYIPVSRRTAEALDSRYMIAGEDEGFTVELKDVNTKSINFVANSLTNVQLDVIVKYTDNTVKNECLFLNSCGQVSAHKNSSVANMIGLAWVGNQYVVKSNANNNTLVDHTDKTYGLGTNNATIDMTMLKVDVDENKIPESVTFKIADTSGKAVAIYAVEQMPVTSDEMKSAIATAREYSQTKAMFTKEQRKTIENAKKYAPILQNAGIDTGDVSFLDLLVADIEKQKNLDDVIYIDISDKYDTDTIVGQAHSLYDLAGDNWFDGYTTNENFGGYMKSSFGKNEIFNGTKYYNDSEGNKQSENVQMYIPNVGRNGGENDTVAIWKEKSVEVKLNEIASEKISIVFHSADAKLVATFYYKDGTTRAEEFYCNTYASSKGTAGFSSLSIAGWTYGHKNSTTGRVEFSSATSGMMGKDYTVDSSKIPEKVVFTAKPANDSADPRPVMLYSVTQTPVVSYTDMKTALESGIENGVLTSEDEAQAELLAKYKSTLVEYGVCEATDYPEVEVYTKQANAQKTSYVDLTEYLNADLMVKAGDIYSDSDKVKLARNEVLYNVEDIRQYVTDENGNISKDTNGNLKTKKVTDNILTVSPSTSGHYANDADTNQVGKTYKLSGNSEKGDDVVQVKSDDTKVNTVEIDMPETIGTVNEIGVILDCNFGDTGKAYSETNNTANGWTNKVPVTVNYTDGTNETVNVNLLKSEGYYLGAWYPIAGYSNGRLDNDKKYKEIYNDNNVLTGYDKTVVLDETVQIRRIGGNGANPPKFFPSNIEIDSSKTVKSLTFKSISGGDYNIVAISQFVQSNAELQGIVSEFDADEDSTITTITDVNEVTADNADDVIKYFGSMLELYNRGFGDALGGSDADENSELEKNYKSYVTKAKALKAGDTGFTATVTIDEDGNNQKATFTMSNLTDSNQTYVLVIAAYVGNKLVGVEASDTEKTVTAGATNVTDSISMAKSTESGVTYKAFVWESLTSLKPLGTSN